MENKEITNLSRHLEGKWYYNITDLHDLLKRSKFPASFSVRAEKID